MADPTYILTAEEGAAALRCEETDAAMLDLLPQVDAFLLTATGHNWAADTTIHATAKSAARMLLVMWHEDPGMMGSVANLNFGLTSCLVQLKALALDYKSFRGRDGAGGCTLRGAQVGDQVTTLSGLTNVTGDQSAAFEDEISVADEIQQVSTDDLSENWYRVKLTSPGDLE